MEDSKAQTVLLAQGEEEQLLRLRKFFLKQGWEILGETRSGVELVDLARQLRPALVVTALSLTGQSGLEALCQLKELRPVVSILVLDSISAPLAQRALECGAAAVVIDPCTDQHLLHQIQSLF